MFALLDGRTGWHVSKKRVAVLRVQRIGSQIFERKQIEKAPSSFLLLVVWPGAPSIEEKTIFF